MHILIAIGTVVMGLIIWSYRIRAAKEALDDVSDLASDVMAAARRLGFRRRPDTTPRGCHRRGKPCRRSAQRGLSRPWLAPNR